MSTRLNLLLLTGVGLFLLLTGYRPHALPYPPEGLFSDAVTSHWGAALFTRTAVFNGDYPLWRDTILAGVPFAANPLNKTAYPLQWLVLMLPPALHINLLILLHMLIAGWGMAYLTDQLALEPIPRLLSVMSYVLAPRFIAHLGLGHVDIIYALAWLPWLIALLHAPPRQHGAGRYTLLLALVAALMLLADVRVSLFGFLLGAAYFLWRLAADFGRVHRFAWTAFAAVIFLPLVAALIVPLISWQSYLTRANLTVDDLTGFSIEPLALAGLILPAHEGSGVEVMVYLGLPVLVLALIGLFTLPRSARWFWGGVLLVAVLWGLGENTPFWSGLAQIGIVRWFRVPGRAWLIVVFSAAILAGYGLQVLMHTADRWRNEPPPKVVFWLRLIAAGAGGLMAVCGATLLVTQIVALKPSTGVMLLFNGLALAIVLLVVLLRRGHSVIVGVSLLAITYADLTVTGVNWLMWRGSDYWLDPYRPVAERLLDDDVQRIYSPSYALPQQVAAAYQLELFYGIDPFQLAPVADAIIAASRVPADGYSVILPPIDVESDEDLAEANQEYTPDSALLARWNVSHVIAAYAIPDPALDLIDTVNDVNIYRNTRFITRQPDPQPNEYPNPDAIMALHQRTMLAVWVSSIAFVLTGVVFTTLSIRRGYHAQA